MGEVAKLAKRDGYRIIREYFDEAISGDDTEKRIAFQQMHHDACNGRDFDVILQLHLIPAEFIQRDGFKPTDYRDFLFARADLFAGQLREALPNADVQITD